MDGAALPGARMRSKLIRCLLTGLLLLGSAQITLACAPESQRCFACCGSAPMGVVASASESSTTVTGSCCGPVDSTRAAAIVAQSRTADHTRSNADETDPPACIEATRPEAIGPRFAATIPAAPQIAPLDQPALIYLRIGRLLL